MGGVFVVLPASALLEALLDCLKPVAETLRWKNAAESLSVEQRL